MLTSGQGPEGPTGLAKATMADEDATTAARRDEAFIMFDDEKQIILG
jgi:hypothetical protein